MTKHMKKPEFLQSFARLATQPDADAYDQIPFQSSDRYGDEDAPSLASPLTWSESAVGLVAEKAAATSIPADLIAVEENTVPSWLWRHRASGKAKASEGDLRLIFDRIVGSAAAKAWRLGYFTSEKHARTFFDEGRYALIQRHIAIAPHVMRSWGLNWAYGLAEENGFEKIPTDQLATMLSNAAIDAVTGHASTDQTSTLWKNLFAVSSKQITNVVMRLSDIASDWYEAGPNPARAAIDVMAFRQVDGSINIEALRQSARFLTILLDLHDRSDVSIGLANLAPLLLALGLTYDSDAGRALAASVAALVTAECTASSAEMAALRGPSALFSDSRESVMRALRNHRRAVYGDVNDYEKLSVLPVSLPLKNCPDLALAAEAQRRWDEALGAARSFGLRAVQTTDLTPSPVLAVLMTSASQGLEPMPSLTTLQMTAADYAQVEVHPAITEALVRLDYSPTSIRAAISHIAGANSLRRAPAINHATLRAHGLSEVTIEKIEAYIPCVNSIRLAITPWIVGLDLCRTVLKISTRSLQSPKFDLLRHLGFDDADVQAANLHCYGHGTALNFKTLHLRHRPLLARGDEISTEARLRMAAAVQSFVSGDVGLTATLPVTESVERGAEIALAAWRRGLKSLTIVFDPTVEAKPGRQTIMSSQRVAPVADRNLRFTPPHRKTEEGKRSSVMLSPRKAVVTGRSTSKH